MEAGTRERLVARAIVKFEIKYDFDVPPLTMKTEISHAKSAFLMKKRVHGLPAELLLQEVVIVLRTAIIESFLDVFLAQATLAR